MQGVQMSSLKRRIGFQLRCQMMNELHSGLTFAVQHIRDQITQQDILRIRIGGQHLILW